MTTERQVRADLDYLADSWPSLIELKTPGSKPRWQEVPRALCPVDELDVDRAGERGVARPAPVDVNVLTLTVDVVHVAMDLVEVVDELVPESTRDRGRYWVSIAQDPRQHLRWVRAWLSAAVQADPERTGPWMGEKLGPVVALTARVLGDVRAGQTLNGLCPWCGGRTDEQPLGGERTLQLLVPADTEEPPVIVCRGLNCRPPSFACGSRVDGFPAWHQREWDWLASELVTAVTEPRRSLRETHPRPVSLPAREVSA